MANQAQTMQNSSNVSGNAIIADQYTYEYIVLLGVLSAFIFLVNFMVILLFATRENLRTKTNTILVSLALSDLLNGFVVVPLHIAGNVHIREQSLRLASMVFYRFIAVSTMLHILAVTLERHICIVSPLRYHSLVTKVRVVKTLAFIWIVSVCNSVVSLSSIALIKEDYNHLQQPPGLENSKLLRFEFAYALFTVFLFFILPLVMMTYSFTKILREISRHNKRDSELMMDRSLRGSSSTDSGDVQTRPSHKLERKPVLIFLTMLLVFAITWSSWYAQILILSVSPSHYKLVGGRWPAFLRSSTSVINPLLYSLIKKDFRLAFKSWFIQIRDFFKPQSQTTTELQNLTSKLPIEARELYRL